jgi:hypothetical protein
VLVASLAACGGDDGGGGSGGGDGGGSGGGDGGGSGGGSTPAHAFCVSETNRYRTQNGKPEVAYSAELEAYANEGAMVDFSSSPHSHFSSTGGGGIAFAENECPQQGNWQVPGDGDISAVVGDCVAAFYSEGPGGGHYENMMGPYATLGCGIYISGSKITIVQDYGY